MKTYLRNDNDSFVSQSPFFATNDSSTLTLKCCMLFLGPKTSIISDRKVSLFECPRFPVLQNTLALGKVSEKRGRRTHSQKNASSLTLLEIRLEKKKFVAKDGSCLPNSTPRQQQFDLAIFVIFQQKLF